MGESSESAIPRRTIMSPRFWGELAKKSNDSFEKEKTKNVIRELLDFPESSVEVHWGIGPHFVNGEIKKMIEEKKIDVLIGEFSPFVVEETLSTPPEDLPKKDRFDLSLIEKLSSPGIGGSPEEIINHAKNLQDLVRKGVAIVTSDSEPNILFKDGSKHPAIIPTIASGLSLLFLAGSAGEVLRKNMSGKLDKFFNNTPRGQFLKRASVALTGLFGAYLYFSLKPPNLGIGRNSFVEGLVRTETDLERFGKDQNFVRFNEGFINLRNIIMALNTWHHLSRVIRNENKLNILFMAGVAHGEVETEFLSGPVRLENKVKKYCERLTNETFNYLYDQNLGENEILRLMVGYGELFSDTHVVGSDDPENFGVNQQAIPSARSVLLRIIGERIKELSSLGGQADKRKLGILQNVKYNLLRKEEEWDFALVFTEEKLIGQRVPHKDLLIKNTVVELNPYEGEYLQYHPDRKEFWLGSAEIDGKVYPLLRDPYGSYGGRDKVLLYRNKTAYLDKRQH